MSIPFRGYLYSRMGALGKGGCSWVSVHVFHDWPDTQERLITGCSILVSTFNVSPGLPPTNRLRMCPCCDFGTATREAEVPKKLRIRIAALAGKVGEK